MDAGRGRSSAAWELGRRRAFLKVEVRTQSRTMREGSERAASKSALLDWKGMLA